MVNSTHCFSFSRLWITSAFLNFPFIVWFNCDDLIRRFPPVFVQRVWKQRHIKARNILLRQSATTKIQWKFKKKKIKNQRSRGLHRQEVAIFLRQTAANFRQSKLWVLNSSTLPLNSPQMGGFQLQILYFWKTIFRQANIWPPSPLPRRYY